MDAAKLVASLISNLGEGETRQTYTLQSGESLRSIAARIGATEAQILHVNPHVRIGSLVGPGDTLILPFSSDDLGSHGNEERLSFGAAGSETEPPVDFPPIVVTPPPGPPPTPPPPPPDNNPPPEPPGDSGGGGSSPPSADSIQDISGIWGEETYSIIQASPTMMQHLQELLDAGWEIRLGPSAWTNHESKVIYLPNTLTPEATVSSLTHEVGHWLRGDNRDWSNADAFISTALRDEAEATAFFLQVRHEYASSGIDLPLLSHSYDTSQLYVQAWHDYTISHDRDQLINDLIEIYSQHERTADGQSYPDFYEDNYNERTGGSGGGGDDGNGGGGGGGGGGGWNPNPPGTRPQQ